MSDRERKEGRTLREATFPIEFETILGDIKAALADGDLDRATALAEDGIAWGERHGDRDAIDRALANRASFQIARGELEGVAREQQAVLMRSRDAATKFMAAHNLSNLFDIRKDLTKSHFYGRLALENATRSGKPSFRAQAHNRLGNILVADSYFEEALAHYEQGRTLTGDPVGWEQAVGVANIGYCQLVLGQIRIGLGTVLSAMRTMVKHTPADPAYFAAVRLSLCYGYIELGRLERARRHGQAALEAAERSGHQEWVKKALYLLGEVEKRAGASLTAYSLFKRLQTEHFPEQSGLAELLMQAETHRLVNLLA